MHAWHDIPVDEETMRDRFPAVIEVPQGSNNKYELDKDTGFLRLDRVLYSAVYYPANYGFIPRTYCDDQDPLDVLVIGQTAVHPLTIVSARAIGVMRMSDEKGIDDKIIAVNVTDPSYSSFTHHNQLPSHMLNQIKHFFLDYKILENKKVLIEDFMGPDEAQRVLREGLQLYKELFAEELKDHTANRLCRRSFIKEECRFIPASQ